MLTNNGGVGPGAAPVPPVAPPAAGGRAVPQINSYANLPFALPRFPYAGPAAGIPTTGGVPGVAVNPVAPAPGTAPPGGPHGLPGLPLPQPPIPTGFPNPFATHSVPAGFPPQAGFGGPTHGFAPPPGYAAPPGLPALPTNLPVPPPQGGFPPQHAGFPPQHAGFPPQHAGFSPQHAGFPPQHAGFSPPAGLPPQGHQAPLISLPIAGQLATQLLNTPAVQSALADLKPILERPDLRGHCLNLSVAILMAPDLQGALRDVAGGALEQAQFATLFAARLRAALAATGARVTA